MKPWYQSVHLWGQVNLTEDDPEKCDLAVWEDYWEKTRVEGVIINCGGIVSYYQSRFPYQYKARTLGDKDYFGIWVKAARRAGLAVVARMDINCTGEELYRLHPEWYCRDKDQHPILSQGRYVACVPNVSDSESGVGHGTHWSILVGQYLMVGANSVIEFIPVANATGINLLLA